MISLWVRVLTFFRDAWILCLRVLIAVFMRFVCVGMVDLVLVADLVVWIVG